MSQCALYNKPPVTDRQTERPVEGESQHLLKRAVGVIKLNRSENSQSNPARPSGEGRLVAKLNVGK